MRFLLRPGGAPSDTLAAMRFAIGSGFAKCSTCQGEDFYPAFPLTPDRREVLVGKPGARLHGPKKADGAS